MFQVVPPCGGHPKARPRGLKLVASFKSCPRVGGIPSGCQHQGPDRGFKSCPRVGGIVGMSQELGRAEKFQVVPPCGGHPPRY